MFVSICFRSGDRGSQIGRCSQVCRSSYELPGLGSDSRERYGVLIRFAGLQVGLAHVKRDGPNCGEQ